MTVRTRSSGSEENAASWSEVKQTTSARPVAGRCGHSGSPSTSGGTGPVTWPNEGNRLSKTTTS
jgi:hypothetical protein